MRIGVLTSSRADFGIYQPLLRQLKNDPEIDLEIIAFGTHLSSDHGYTLDNILEEGFKIVHQLKTLLPRDDKAGISASYALTVAVFSEFWDHHQYDLVFCLGDRFEMSAAIQAGIPFEIQFAHIHGGETTLGAIDNTYRHQISLASKVHFTSTETYAGRVKELVEDERWIYPVGSLSLDGLDELLIPDWEDVRIKFNIPDKDYILITFHPETVSPERNLSLATQMFESLVQLAQNSFLIVTMPNADTLGSVYREQLQKLHNENSTRVILIENFGKLNYFSAMQHSKYLLGNTSSSIIEAASFKKYAVNVGDRQKGRERSPNIIDCGFDTDSILLACSMAEDKGDYEGPNVYYKDGAAEQIQKVIKQFKP